MEWNNLFNKENEPSNQEIKEFVDTPLYDDLDNYLRETYKVQPKLFYSSCSMDNGYWKGWNIKYKKSGKSLCTLYPKQGFFAALITVSAKQISEDDVLILLRSDYMKDLFVRTKAGTNGKSLPIEVRNKNILRDVKTLIELRASSV